MAKPIIGTTALLLSMLACTPMGPTVAPSATPQTPMPSAVSAMPTPVPGCSPMTGLSPCNDYILRTLGSGRVVDANGQLLPGATVSLTDLTWHPADETSGCFSAYGPYAVSDTVSIAAPDGRFTTGYWLPGGPVSLTVRRPGYAAKTVTVEAKANLQGDPDLNNWVITLVPMAYDVPGPAPIAPAGYVIDEWNHRVAGVTVRAELSNGQRFADGAATATVTTDAAGLYVLPAMPQTAAASLVASKPGLEPETYTIAYPDPIGRRGDHHLIRLYRPGCKPQ